jgi:hypothetical protein
MYLCFRLRLFLCTALSLPLCLSVSLSFDLFFACILVFRLCLSFVPPRLLCLYLLTCFLYVSLLSSLSFSLTLSLQTRARCCCWCLGDEACPENALVFVFPSSLLLRHATTRQGKRQSHQSRERQRTQHTTKQPQDQTDASQLAIRQGNHEIIPTKI